MGRYRFDPAAPVLVVFATIQGKQPTQRRRLKVALDTGAIYTMIPWEIARALGYQPELSRQQIEMMTASGMAIVPLIKVKEFRSLGQTVKGLELLVHDLPSAGRVEGLLGLNFLRAFKLTLDFKRGILELE